MTRSARAALEALEAAVVANHEVFMRTSDRLAPVLAELGLTHATAQALWTIDPDEPPPSMKEMSRRLFCNAPNLSFVVNQLVDRGLVERSVDPADRRSRVVVLTKKGRRVRAEVVDHTLALTPFAGLSPQEVRQLTKLLGKALDAATDAD
ncbi:MarR family winged helix-turn-helix transcriptional regulator [Streptomyces longisporoflavus]|uniref:MarR family winged helix-turn-helix transcriptional regulator n=1 Tax=Streptomyces longisporoflavus TaxID=28044 RepID=A0ABW7R037_9ACTN